MNTGSILTGAIAPVMVWVISLGGTARAFFAQWFIGLVFSIYSGPLFAFMPGKRSAPAFDSLTTLLNTSITAHIHRDLSREDPPD